MKRYVVKLFPSKDGVQELLKCEEKYHLKDTPKFIADGWNGQEPLYYDGGAYYFKCYHQNISNAKLFNSRKAAKNKIDDIYWMTNLHGTFEKAIIVEIELSIKEGESDVFDFEKRYADEKANGKDFNKIGIIVEPIVELIIH